MLVVFETDGFIVRSHPFAFSFHATATEWLLDVSENVTVGFSDFTNSAGAMGRNLSNVVVLCSGTHGQPSMKARVSSMITRLQFDCGIDTPICLSAP